MIIDCKSMANRIMQEAKDQIEQTPGARRLGGAKITESTVSAARDMRELAEQQKIKNAGE